MLPIVMHHGLFGFGNVTLGRLRWCYFHGIDRAIAARGHDVFVPRVHPTAGIDTRAAQLKRSILDRYPEGKVVLLGHSLGGLDARYMVSRLGMEDRVAAVLTVCTPHRGSPYADWAVRHVGRRLRGFELMKFLHWDVQGIVDLTTDACARFNEVVPDAPGVPYFSISAAKSPDRVPAIAAHAHRIISAAEGPNDVMVSVGSAKWGTHLETWPVDHFHSINRRLTRRGDEIGDVAPLYLRALRRVGVDAPREPSAAH